MTLVNGAVTLVNGAVTLAGGEGQPSAVDRIKIQKPDRQELSVPPLTSTVPLSQLLKR